MNPDLMVFIHKTAYLVQQAQQKMGAYVINLDEYKSVGAHWRALYMNCNNLKYFACFRVK